MIREACASSFHLQLPLQPDSFFSSVFSSSFSRPSPLSPAFLDFFFSDILNFVTNMDFPILCLLLILKHEELRFLL